MTESESVETLHDPLDPTCITHIQGEPMAPRHICGSCARTQPPEAQQQMARMRAIVISIDIATKTIKDQYKKHHGQKPLPKDLAREVVIALMDTRG